MWTLRALRLGMLLTPILPAGAGYAICRLVGLALLCLNREARRAVLDNQCHVAPGASRRTLYRRALGVFTTVVMNYYDLLRLSTVDRDRLLHLLEVEGQEHLEGAFAAGRGAIILSAHLGNFGVVAQYPGALGRPAVLVVEHVHPEPLFQFMARLRSALGIGVIPPGRQAALPILRLLRNDGVLILAGDRDVLHRGMRVEFFGRPASLPTGPVELAARTGTPLIPAYTVRLSSRRSLVRIAAPLELARTGDKEADLRDNTMRMARTLERMIASAPGQWAVLQRIWQEDAETENAYSSPASITR
ncbi:MAG TPA: lysophospholipid acyltransferase family protein [Thermomicrobiaceae bacterium]|nr:lysophospholipid acyltransferase family protein [Thermomicrobiaceae bacterium]